MAGVAQGDLMGIGCAVPGAVNLARGLVGVVAGSGGAGSWVVETLTPDPDSLVLLDADALTSKLFGAGVPVGFPVVGASIQLSPQNRAVVSPDWKAWKVAGYGVNGVGGGSTWMLLENVNDPHDMVMISTAATPGTDFEVLQSP
jgi:hypothetical protein